MERKVSERNVPKPLKPLVPSSIHCISALMAGLQRVNMEVGCRRESVCRKIEDRACKDDLVQTLAEVGKTSEKTTHFCQDRRDELNVRS